MSQTAESNSAAGDNDSQSDGGDEFSAGANRIRDTAKWLVAGFGALGGALIASVHYSDIGKAEGVHATLAVVGFALAILGVLLALLAAASVLSPAWLTLHGVLRKRHLMEYFRDNSDLLQGFSSVEDVTAVYDAAAKARVATYQRQLFKYYGALSDYDPRVESPAPPPEVQEKPEEGQQYADRLLELVGPVVTLVLGVGLFEVIRRRWMRLALPGIVLGVVLAATGATLFAIQVQQTSPTRVTEALITIDRPAQWSLKRILGAQCDMTDMRVEVLAHTADQWRFEPVSAGCHPTIFEVSSNEVIIQDELLPCPVSSASASGSAAPLIRPGTNVSPRFSADPFRQSAVLSIAISSPSASASPAPSRSPPGPPGKGPVPAIKIC